MYDCIIFDVDGTLIDTENVVFKAYQKVIYEEYGRYFTREEIAPAYGVPTREALIILGFKNVDEASEKHQKYLLEFFSEVQPFEGVTKTLEFLYKNGVTMGVVTSRNKAETEKDPCFEKLMKYFNNNIVCSDDTKEHKPNPEPLLKAVEKTGVQKSKILYVGDTYYDYMCAKNAGVDFALALWGATNTKNMEAKYMLGKPEDVISLVEIPEV